MKIQHFVGAMVLALVGVGQSVYGEQPSEIFAKLAEPSVAVQRNAEARAKAIPALSCLPSDAEGVLAVKVPEGCDENVDCIGSAAICAEKGSTQASKDMLGAFVTLSSIAQVAGLNSDEGGTQEDKTEKQRVAEGQIAQFIQEKLEVLYQKLEKGSVPGVYAVLTARPGKEKEFADWANATSSRMFQKLPEGSQKVSEQGFTGIKLSMVDLAVTLLQGLKNETHVQFDAARLHKALDNRFVYLLTRQDEGAMKFVICENPEQIHTPSSLEDSLATSPLLDGMDAHVDSVIATARIPKDMLNYMHSEEMSQNNLALLDLLRSVFHEMSQRFPQEAKQFTVAADGSDEVRRQLSAHGTQLTSDCTLQVWGEGNDVLVELAGDATTASACVPGELKHLDLAAEPGNLFYAESTPFPAPFPLLNLQKLTGAVIDIVTGYSLMLNEAEKDDMAGTLTFMQQGRTMIEGAAAGLDKIFAELSGPFTLVVTENASEAQGGQPQQFAAKGGVQIAVRNQSGLDEGWNQFCTSVSPLIGSPILSFLPFQAATLPDGATSHTLLLPPELLRGLTPQIIRDNSSIVFASDADTARRLHEPSATKFPLCGAVFSLNTKLFDKVAGCAGTGTSLGVDHIYGVSSQRGNHATLRLRLVATPAPSN